MDIIKTICVYSFVCLLMLFTLMSCDELLTSLEDEGGPLRLYIGIEEGNANLSELDSLEVPVVEYIQFWLGDVRVASSGTGERTFSLNDSLVLLTAEGEVQYLAEKIIPEGNYREISIQFNPSEEGAVPNYPAIEIGGFFQGEPYTVRLEGSIQTTLNFNPPVQIQRNSDEVAMLQLLLDRSSWFLNSEDNGLLDPREESNSQQIITNIINSIGVVEGGPSGADTNTPNEGNNNNPGGGEEEEPIVEEPGEPVGTEYMLKIDTYSGLESEAMFIFPVVLSTASEDTVSADYQAQGLSAKAGQDFQSVSGTLVLEPGVLEAEIHVPILEDDLNEPDEKFTVVLSNAVNATVDKMSGKAVATIFDND